MTVVWHVDYLKIYHKNLDKVKDLLTHLEKLYGEKFPVSRGKKIYIHENGFGLLNPGSDEVIDGELH